MPSLVVYKHPMRFTSMVFRLGGRRSPFSSVFSSRKVSVIEMPALAKTWSIFPYSLMAALNMSSWDAQFVTSILQNGIVEASGEGRGLRSEAKTLPPCLMTRRSVARPMPDDAPENGEQYHRAVCHGRC